jgi:hypothetical protein
MRRLLKAAKNATVALQVCRRDVAVPRHPSIVILHEDTPAFLGALLLSPGVFYGQRADAEPHLGDAL